MRLQTTGRALLKSGDLEHKSNIECSDRANPAGDFERVEFSR
jgi:hypothetical protein